MRLSLGSVLNTIARYAWQGACATDDRVIPRINEARERIMRSEQNWRGKVQRFIFCASNACITLPREIETVEAATVCNSPMKMRSPWYDVLDGGPVGPLCGGDAFVDRGDGYVTFTDLDEARSVKIYADVEEDDGARILIQGFDQYGNRVRTFDEETSAYVDGEYVEIDNETPQSSTTVFSSIDGLQKPETNGFVRVYAFTEGVTAVAASDVTTLAQWPNDVTITPLTTMEDGGGDVPWDGELVSFEWLTGPEENIDLVLTFTWDGDSNVTVTDARSFDGLTDYMPLSGLIELPESTITFTSFVDDGTFPNNFRFVATNFSELTSQTRKVVITRHVTHPAEYTSEFPSTATIDATWVSGDTDVDLVLQATSNGTEWDFNGNNAWTTEGDEVVISIFDSVFTPYAVGSSLGQWELDFSFTLDGDPLGRIQATIQNFPMADQYTDATITFRITRTITAAVTGVPDYLSIMAILHPDETLPSYRRYEVPKLRTQCCGGSGASTDPKQVIVMGKLRYLPVLRTTDFLIIENLGALKNMLLALDAEDKGDLALAVAYEAKAFEILAKELRNHMGDAATANEGVKMQFNSWSANEIPNIL